MQTKKNITFLALLRLSFALDYTKNALKHSLKRLFKGGANRLPTKMQNKENITFLASSVARVVGGYSPPSIDMSTKMQNGENATFVKLLRLFYALEWNK